MSEASLLTRGGGGGAYRAGKDGRKVTKGNEEASERKRKEEEGKERGKKGRNAAMCAKRGVHVLHFCFVNKYKIKCHLLFHLLTLFYL